jgi:hypothetical protein
MEGFSKENIDAIKKGDVGGEVFLALTIEHLTKEFECKFAQAVKIMKLVDEKNKDEVSIYSHLLTVRKYNDIIYLKLQRRQKR